jgi:hypothetical protein
MRRDRQCDPQNKPALNAAPGVSLAFRWLFDGASIRRHAAIHTANSVSKWKLLGDSCKAARLSERQTEICPRGRARAKPVRPGQRVQHYRSVPLLPETRFAALGCDPGQIRGGSVPG